MLILYFFAAVDALHLFILFVLASIYLYLSNYSHLFNYSQLPDSATSLGGRCGICPHGPMDSPSLGRAIQWDNYFISFYKSIALTNQGRRKPENNDSVSNAYYLHLITTVFSSSTSCCLLLSYNIYSSWGPLMSMTEYGTHIHTWYV